MLGMSNPSILYIRLWCLQYTRKLRKVGFLVFFCLRCIFWFSCPKIYTLENLNAMCFTHFLFLFFLLAIILTKLRTNGDSSQAEIHVWVWIFQAGLTKLFHLLTPSWQVFSFIHILIHPPKILRPLGFVLVKIETFIVIKGKESILVDRVNPRRQKRNLSYPGKPL